MGRHAVMRTAIFLTALAMLLASVGYSTAATIRLVPSTTTVKPGEDLSFDVVVDGIPEDGLNGVQFRLNVIAPNSAVAGVTSLSTTQDNAVSVLSPLLMLPATGSSSGLGGFFHDGKGPNGILEIDNGPFDNGSGLYTFAHTFGAVRPTGGGVVATFRLHVGETVTAENINAYITDVLLLDGGVAYPVTVNEGASVQLRCLTMVPSLMGLTLPDATAALAAAGLTQGSIYEVTNDGTKPLGVILEQSVAAGDKADCESIVNLAVNTAPLDVTGLSGMDKTADESGAILLSWMPSASTDTAGYRVYLADGGSSTLLKTLNDPQAGSAELSGLADREHTFRISAFDLMDNENSGASVTVVVKDDVPPAVSITGVEDGAFYNAGVTPGVSATDAHLALQTVTLNGQPYEMAPITTDGGYALVLIATDEAGNISTAQVSFVIDTTVPVISITSIEDSGYYNAGLLPVIKVDDANLGSAAYMLDGEVYEMGTPVGAEGIHNLSVTAVDKAGNSAATVLSFAIDKTYPLSSAEVGEPKVQAGETIYVGGETPITLLASDAGLVESGVTGMEYAVDGSDWTRYVSAFSLTGLQDGNHMVSYRASDRAGNIGQPCELIISLDNTAPATTASVGEPKYVAYDGAPFITGASVITLAATDGLSGVSSTEYRVDGGDWTAYSPFTVASAGAHTIGYRSADSLGNGEAVGSLSVVVDNAPPATTVAVGEPKHVTDDGTIYVSDTSAVTLSAADNLSGVASTEYRVDGGAWVSYAPFTVAAERSHTIEYRSVDNLGNLETTGVFTIVVDSTPPVTTIMTGDPKHTAADGNLYITKATSFTLAVSDSLSGVASTEYRVDSGDWAAYAPFTVSGEGAHTVEYRSADNLGNVESTGSLTIFADNSAPASTVSVGEPKHVDADGMLYITKETPFTLTVTDDMSGVAATEYRVDSGDWTSYAPFTVPSEGGHIIEYRGKDNLGNIGAAGSLSVITDNSPPLNALSAGEPKYTSEDGTLYISGASVFTLSAIDSQAGVASTEYRADDGDWNPYAPFTVAANGVHIIACRSTDNLGNSETTGVRVVVDNAAPVTAIEVGAPNYTSGDGTLYVTGSSVFTLETTDELSGSSITEYRIDSGEWASYAPFVVPDEGEHVIEYRAKDNLGNMEEAGVFSVVVDNTPPVSTYSFEKRSYADGGKIYLSPDSVITLSAVDELSGVAGSYCRIDDGEYARYAEPFTLAGLGYGNHVLDFYSVDNVGGAEKVWSIPFTLMAIDVETGILNVPRILVFTGDSGKPDEQEAEHAWMQWFVGDALKDMDAYYSIVYDKADFIDAFRSGVFNTYVIMDQSAPFDDVFISELKEAVYSSDGLLVSGWGNNVKEHVEEMLGVQFPGPKSGKYEALTLRLVGSSLSTAQDLACWCSPIGTELAGGTNAGMLTADGAPNPVICATVMYNCAVEKGDVLVLSLSNPDRLIDHEEIVVSKLPVKAPIPDTLGSLEGNLIITDVSQKGVTCKVKPTSFVQDYSYSLSLKLMRAGRITAEASCALDVSAESALDAGVKTGGFDVVSIERVNNSKPGPDIPGIVLNEYGLGKTVFMSFNMADTAKAANADGYAALFANAMNYLLPREARTGSESVVLAYTKLTMRGTDMDIISRETLDDGLDYMPLFMLNKELPLDYSITLKDGVPSGYRYFVRKPDYSGDYVRRTELLLSHSGIPSQYGVFTHHMGVEKDSLDLSANLIEMFRDLIDAYPDSVGAISEWLVDFEYSLIMPENTRDDLDKKIHAMVMLIRRLDNLEADTTSVRLDIDRLIGILQAKWSLVE